MNNFSILSATGGYQYEDMFGGTGGGDVAAHFEKNHALLN